MEWVLQTIQQLRDCSSDNTLIGVQTQIKAFTAFRNGEKPQRSAEKTAILSLYESITRNLEKSTHHRTQFSPSVGLSTSDLTSKWTELEEAEKLRDDFLGKELQRFFYDT